MGEEEEFHSCTCSLCGPSVALPLSPALPRQSAQQSRAAVQCGAGPRRRAQDGSHHASLLRLLDPLPWQTAALQLSKAPPHRSSSPPSAPPPYPGPSLSALPPHSFFLPATQSPPPKIPLSLPSLLPLSSWRTASPLCLPLTLRLNRDLGLTLLT